MGSNVIKLVTERAANYPDNPAVQSLLVKLQSAQMVAKSNAMGPSTTNPLHGYELASEGEEGFSLLINPTDGIFRKMLAQSYYLHEVAIIADCLASVMIALGDDMQY